MGLLENKVALVTGAASGIGRATAIMLAKEGAKVTVNGHVNVEGAMETVRMIKGAGGEAIMVQADVSKADQVEALVKRTVDTFGGLHCACNNAFYQQQQRLDAHMLDEDEWNKAITVNLTGTWLCMKYEIPVMLAGGGGSIVNVSSVAGIKGEPYQAHYSASKGGINALTMCAAAEYAARGIRVNAVAPGAILTPAFRAFFQYMPEAKTIVDRAHAMNRMGEVEEIADVITWLCSDRSSFVTGIVLPADGGALVADRVADMFITAKG